MSLVITPSTWQGLPEPVRVFLEDKLRRDLWVDYREVYRIDWWGRWWWVVRRYRQQNGGPYLNMLSHLWQRVFGRQPRWARIARRLPLLARVR